MESPRRYRRPALWPSRFWKTGTSSTMSSGGNWNRVLRDLQDKADVLKFYPISLIRYVRDSADRRSGPSNLLEPAGSPAPKAPWNRGPAQSPPQNRRRPEGPVPARSGVETCPQPIWPEAAEEGGLARRAPKRRDKRPFFLRPPERFRARFRGPERLMSVYPLKVAAPDGPAEAPEPSRAAPAPAADEIWPAMLPVKHRWPLRPLR